MDIFEKFFTKKMRNFKTPVLKPVLKGVKMEIFFLLGIYDHV
jgi:hypothetical protein